MKKSPKKKSPGSSSTKKSVRGRSSKAKTQAKGGAKRTKPAKDNECVIVGVGASAGGLEAIRQLLEPMPADPGFAVVIIQHLDPNRKSLVPELLKKYCKMKVGQVEDHPKVEPNHVYIIPPGKYLSVSKGELRLSEPNQPRGARMAVDFFLRSLAEDRKQRGVGVILSGTGADGALGVKAIKAAGGLVIAQDPETAAFDGMPRSAINSGVVDHVLSPNKISKSLMNYARHPYVREEPNETVEEKEKPSGERKDAGFEGILSLLRVHTRNDFSSYKENTLLRRTRRRMCLHHFQDFKPYLEYLRAHPGEIDALTRDLLISVTDFFREPEAWEQLRQIAIRPMIERKGNDDPVRVWTPGCATGEEPYSAAMLILEELKQAGKHCPLHVFASDLDKTALEYARLGRYPKSIQADVSEGRIREFFTTVDGDDYYQVNKTLRESLVFADQNLIADPPFSKLDLICCRNLLIYLKPEVQDKIVSLFHFALRESGALFLGSAETIGRQTDLFETSHKRWRIFKRIGPNRRDRVEIPISKSARGRAIEPPAPPTQVRSVRLTRLAQQRLLEALAPAAVLIDEQWRIQFISGNVDPYLTHAPGSPSDDLLEKVRNGLRSKLRVAVQKALSENRTLSISACVQRDSEHMPVVVTVRIIRDAELNEKLVLVQFEKKDERSKDERSASGTPPPSEETPRSSSGEKAKAPVQRAHEEEIDDHVVIRRLEDELAASKEDLQITVEQLETSNEEFKASNEEVMSINEELQSANEELETSKEELQSLNEELSTVNHQLNAKVEELEIKHGDLENLVAATDVAAICLDTRLAIRWFTPAAQEIIRLKPGDKGRPLTDFSHDFPDGNLVKMAERVLKKMTPIEDEAVCQDGRVYLRRAMLYRTDRHRIGGVVITMIDITRRKKDELVLREAKELSDKIIDTVREATLVLDGDLRVKSADRKFYDKFMVSPKETLGQSIYELGNGQWNIPALRRMLEKVLPKDQVLEGFLVDHSFQKIGRRVMMLNARRIDNPPQVLLAIDDITQRYWAEQALRESEKRFRELADNIDQFAWTCDQLGSANWFNKRWYEFTGTTLKEMQGWGWKKAHHPDHLDRVVKNIRHSFETGETWEDVFPIRGKDGGYRWFLSRAQPIRGERGEIVRWFGTNTDITERKEAEEALRQLNESLEQKVARRTETLNMLRRVAEECHRASAMDEAIRFVLKEFGHYHGWRFGRAFQPDPRHPARMIQADPFYEEVPGRFGKFLHSEKERRVSKGRALPGRVWKSGKPACVNYAKAVHRRTDLHAKLGIKTAAAFPVTLGNEVIAILEFFSDIPISFDDRMIEAMKDIGTQLARVEERARAQEALMNSEARMRRLVESNIAGVFIADSDGVIVEANRAFLTLLGYHKSDIAKRALHWTRQFPPGHKEFKNKTLEELARRGAIQPCEIDLARKNGDRIATVFGLAKLGDGSDGREDTVGFVVDFSDVRSLQKQILEISDFERQRIGQDLHDSFGQQVTGLKFRMSSLIKQLRREASLKAEEANSLLDLVKKIENGAHSIAQGLIPIRDQPEGLDNAIQEMAIMMSNLYGRDCEFKKSTNAKVSDSQVAMHLYRIAHEAVGNAMKHAKPGKVEIRLSKRGNRLVLEIKDNGTGMSESQKTKKTRMGMDIMAYRARLIGAELSIDSQKGKGTTVTCVSPFEVETVQGG